MATKGHCRDLRVENRKLIGTTDGPRLGGGSLGDLESVTREIVNWLTAARRMAFLRVPSDKASPLRGRK
jgi:hypothetical protein